MTNEGYILKNFFPKRFLSWGLKTLFASTSSGDGRQPSSVRRLGSTGEISARRPVLLCTACGRLIHLKKSQNLKNLKKVLYHRRQISDFIYTKNFAIGRSGFIYTKNRVRLKPDFIYTKSCSVKIR